MALFFERQHANLGHRWGVEVSWDGSRGLWIGNKPQPTNRYSLGTYSALKALLTQWDVER